MLNFLVPWRLSGYVNFQLLLLIGLLMDGTEHPCLNFFTYDRNK
jgi:hypothetical protein